MSRSIGDRGAARGCIATPEINTVTVAGGHGARVVVCSDGVWDVYSSEKAMTSLKGYTQPEAAARRICKVAREKREYGGKALDDISAIVVDIGPRRGRPPLLSCVPDRGNKMAARKGGCFGMCMGGEA